MRLDRARTSPGPLRLALADSPPGAASLPCASVLSPDRCHLVQPMVAFEAGEGRSSEPNASRKLRQRKARPAAISVRFPFTDSCRASVA